MKTLIGFAIVLLTVVAMATLGGALVSDSPGFPFSIGIASIAGIVFLFRIDRKAEEKARKAKQELDASRLAALSAGKGASLPLEIRGSSYFFGIALVETAIGISVLYLFLPYADIVAIGIGLLLLGLGVFTLLHATRGWGKPVLTLSREGFQTPHTPLVPWKIVDGIFVQTVKTRYSYQHWLTFRIETLPEVIGTFSAFHRLTAPLRFGINRKNFRIAIRGSKEDPDFVREAAQRLWSARTGSNYVWQQLWSDDLNLKRKEVERLERQLSNASGGNPASLAESLSRLREQSERVAQGISVESKRIGRQFKWMRAALFIAVAGMLISLALRLVNLLS